MKTTKKVITLILALALIFALCAPAFAKVPGYQPVALGVPYYVQGADNLYQIGGDGTFTVYLSIYSGTYDGAGPINRTIAVPMGVNGVTGVKYTVADVLTKAALIDSDLHFDTTTPDPTGEHETWLHKIMDEQESSSVWCEAFAFNFSPNPAPHDHYCGWMFRINGMVPYYEDSTTHEIMGCYVTDAYVTDQDTIDLYYCDIYTEAMSTKIVYIALDSYNYGVATFQVLASECYKGYSDTNWTMTTWAKVTNSSLNVIIDGVTQTITTNKQGKFTKTGLGTGNHSVQFVSQPSTTAYYYNDTTNNILHTYYVPSYVGMYSVYNF